MSIGGILSTAARALVTHQKALAVTTHNISNAETEGYSRQRAVLTATDPLITPEGVIGTGVRIDNIERVRDPLLDATWRRENASSSFYGERAQQLSRIEQAFGEPSDTGLLATVDAFWNSWSDLANDPTSDAARSVLRERGRQLADRLDQVSAGLTEVKSAGSNQLDSFVDRVNELAEHVADINHRIITTEAAGGTAGDLRDARDRAVDELSTLVTVQVVNRDGGDVGVYVDGQALVDGTTSRGLERATDGSGNVTVRFRGRSQDIGEVGGRIGGLLETLNNEVGTAVRELDDFTEALVNQVNALLDDGVSPDGAHGNDFFDPAGTSASTIALSAAVTASPDAIAAGAGTDNGDGTWTYLPGNNEIALDIQQLRDTPVSGTVLAERYSRVVARVGSQVSAAKASTEVHETLAQQANIRRESMSGVSIDEELTLMIRQQAAYSAAARVVTRVDEMMQTLIGMV